MRFAWDEDKNRRNIAKHGISFQAVRLVFSNRAALVLKDERRDYGEDRFIILCPLADEMVHVTYTLRGGFTRIISARRANHRERRYYEQLQEA